MGLFSKRSKVYLSADGSKSTSPLGSPVPSPPNTPGLTTSSSGYSSSSSSGLSREPSMIRVPKDPYAGRDPPSMFSFFSPGAAEDGGAFSNFESPRLKVLIVGTGFAGLSSAIACARQGFSVTVLERTSGLSQHGDSIVFGSNASLLLHRWGVGQEMYERNGSKGDRWEFRDQSGELLHEEDVGGFKQTFGAPLLQGRRAGFLGSLGTEARMLGVRILLDSEVVAYSDSEDQPGVQLSSGELLRSDVIIVADGVHSPARDLLAPHDRPATQKQPSGYSIHRGVASGEALKKDRQSRHLLDGNVRIWLGKDAHCCTYPMDNGRSLAFTFTHRDPSTSSSLNWRDKRSMDDLLAHIGPEWDPVLLNALTYFPSALHWPIFEEKPAEEWISRGGKICFVGDSIHAMQPTSFQGGSQAVEDAATVALCLALAGGDSAGVFVALQTYEALRRPRVGEAQKLGAKQQHVWHHYTADASGHTDLTASFSHLSLSPPFSSSASSPPSSPFTVPSAPSLRPLSFALYGHDAERFALSNFAAFAAAVDPSFKVRDEWVVEAARRAEVPLPAEMRKKQEETVKRRQARR
ncbi:hypothetical protein JCM8097_000252 [Rhodosporidiobolus ruineniae]